MSLPTLPSNFPSPIVPMKNSFRLLASTLVMTLALVTDPLSAQEKTQPAGAGGPSPSNSLVRVNATLQAYNFLRPWEKGNPTPRRGLGALLSGGRVLVTAELVVNSTYIELELPTTGEKTPARIVGLDYEANLALLAPVDEKSQMLAKMVPFELDLSVKAPDTISVWQVEDNGDGVSTDLDVLRTTVGEYFVSGSILLVYQVKGSLQYRANSFTLPAVRNNKLVGLLLSYDSKELTSSLLPAPIIQHFLDDLKDGKYDGFPSIGLGFAQTLDDQFRKFTGLEQVKGGVFVRNVAKEGSAAKAGIEEGDVIVKIAGKEIDSRGNYAHPIYGKLNFSHLVRGDAKVGDTLKFDLIRKGKPLGVDVKLERREPGTYLIDPYMFDRGPRYLIFGGLIFQELTRPYLESWGKDWPTRAPFNLVYSNANPEKYEQQGREKLVFLSQVLRTPATLGYENLNSIVVDKVDGKPIKSLADLADALNGVTLNGLHKIELEDYPRLIWVHDGVSRKVNDQLLGYGIGSLTRLE